MGAIAGSVTHDRFVSSTSYLPAVRAGFEFPLSADADVQRWRRMGASWQAIANNFGCPVDKVRRTWDPQYLPAHTPAQPLVLPKVDGGPDGPGRVSRATYQHDALIALEPAPLARDALGGHLAIRPQDFRRMVENLMAKRLIVEPRKNLFRITPDGVAELRRLEREPCRALVQPKSGMRHIGLEVRQARRLKVLRALEAGPRDMSAVADVSGLALTFTSDVLRSLRETGEVDGRPSGRGRGFIWWLTGEGRSRLAASGDAA